MLKKQRYIIPLFAVSVLIIIVILSIRRFSTPIHGLFSRFERITIRSPRTENIKPGNIWGVDLSHHQRQIDWHRLTTKQKPDFIFLKATEGSSHIDSRYTHYRQQARNHRIPVGAYHFFSYTSPGLAQAKHFIQTAQLQPGDLLPVLDVEYRNKMNRKQWIHDEIAAFCREIKKEYGVDPIIYCECAYYQQYLSRDFTDFHYWISDLRRQPRCNYLIWQYTANGLVEGIGPIDNSRLRDGATLTDLQLP
jgi:lysozyme